MTEPLKTMEAVPVPPIRDPKDVEENKDLAALSYAWIMSLVLLFSKKHSPFVHYHAKQGTVLFVLSVVFWLIPYANRVLELFVFFLMVWGFLAAAQGNWTELPFVGSLVRGKFSLRGSWKQTVAAIVYGKNWVVSLWTHHDKQTGTSPSTLLRTDNSQPAPNAQSSTPSATFPLQPSTPLKQQDIPPVDSSNKF